MITAPIKSPAVLTVTFVSSISGFPGNISVGEAIGISANNRVIRETKIMNNVETYQRIFIILVCVKERSNDTNNCIGEKCHQESNDIPLYNHLCFARFLRISC